VSGRRLKVRVVTPRGTLFEGEAEEVVAPSVLGYFGVLPRHAPMRCLLVEGILRIKLPDGSERRFRIGPGFFEVEKDRVSIALERAEEAEDSISPPPP